MLEAADLPLVGVLGLEAAQVFAELHRSNGVDPRCGVEIAAGRLIDLAITPPGQSAGPSPPTDPYGFIAPRPPSTPEPAPTPSTCSPST